MSSNFFIVQQLTEMRDRQLLVACEYAVEHAAAHLLALVTSSLRQVKGTLKEELLDKLA